MTGKPPTGDHAAEVCYLWAISRLCEEFHTVPAVADRLLLDDPQDLAVRVLELRSYAAAKAEYDAAGGKIDQLDQTPMMDHVISTTFALHKERLARRMEGLPARGGSD